MNDSERVKTMIRSVEGILDGHFVLKGRRHARRYVDKDLVTAYPVLARDVAGLMAHRLRDQNIDAVVAPLVGATVLGAFVADHLTTMRDGRAVLFMPAEKHGIGDFRIRDSHANLLGGRRVCVVEDVMSSGGSAAKVVALIRKLGGEVVCAVCMWNRGGVLASAVGVPTLFSLIEEEIKSWAKDECPLCEAAEPISTNVGYGSVFLSENPDYPRA